MATESQAPLNIDWNNIEYETYNVVLSFTAVLPRDLDIREQVYGTIDPVECFNVDMDNDGALFLLDGTDNFHIDDVFMDAPDE